MDFPNLSNSILSHGIFLILGPSLCLIAVGMSVRTIRTRHWPVLLFASVFLLIGMAMSYTNYSEVYTSWSFRRQLTNAHIQSVIIQKVDKEMGSASDPLLTIRNRDLINDLTLKLTDSEEFWRDHESFEDGYLLRFELADGSLSPARLIVWKKSNKGRRYIVMPQVSDPYAISADMYESYKFVSVLSTMIDAAKAENHTVLE